MVARPPHLRKFSPVECDLCELNYLLPFSRYHIRIVTPLTNIPSPMTRDMRSKTCEDDNVILFSVSRRVYSANNHETAPIVEDVVHKLA